jgi:hypothetical protein
MHLTLIDLLRVPTVVVVLDIVASSAAPLGGGSSHRDCAMTPVHNEHIINEDDHDG